MNLFQSFLKQKKHSLVSLLELTQSVDSLISQLTENVFLFYSDNQIFFFCFVFGQRCQNKISGSSCEYLPVFFYDSSGQRKQAEYIVIYVS